MTREELLALCAKAPKIGEVAHAEFADYFVILERKARDPSGQWKAIENAYMSVDGRVAMANEDHRRQGKQLYFLPPTVLTNTEEELTLQVTITSEAYGERTGIATSRKLAGVGAEKSFPWEVAQTSAIGRALASFGYGVIPGAGLASAEDVQRATQQEEIRPKPQGHEPAGVQVDHPRQRTEHVPSSLREVHTRVQERRIRPVSEFQRQKLLELAAESFEVEAGELEDLLNDLFEEQVGHGIDEATYDEGRQVTAFLLRDGRRRQGEA